VVDVSDDAKVPDMFHGLWIESKESATAVEIEHKRSAFVQNRTGTSAGGGRR